MDVEHVVAAELDAQLADRLEERQALDVADRAADLGQHDVDVARSADAQDAALISSVMCGMTCTVLAQVLALALLADHRVVDPAGGELFEARDMFSSMKRS